MLLAGIADWPRQANHDDSKNHQHHDYGNCNMNFAASFQCLAACSKVLVGLVGLVGLVNLVSLVNLGFIFGHRIRLIGLAVMTGITVFAGL